MKITETKLIIMKLSKQWNKIERMKMAKWNNLIRTDKQDSYGECWREIIMLAKINNSHTSWRVSGRVCFYCRVKTKTNSVMKANQNKQVLNKSHL